MGNKEVIARIIKRAKQTYSQDTQHFNSFLTYVSPNFQDVDDEGFQEYPSYQSINQSYQDGLAEGQKQASQMQQSPVMPQQAQAPMMPQQQAQSAINPGNINIVSKNYIMPDALKGGENQQKKEKKSHALAKLPDNILKSSATQWEPINYRNIDDKYHLYELAKVHIKFDETSQKVIYEVIEPDLTKEEWKIYEELRRGFIYVFERISTDELMESPKEVISQGAKRLCTRYKIKVTDDQLSRLIYYLNRDFLGLEIIEPLLHDPYIEDISCDGLNVPIFVNHLKYGPLEVNRLYTNADKLNSFIVKLAQKTNQEISLSKPILQGALPDGSRVEAIYGKEVSEKGSSYTIRKFRAEPFTPIHLVEFGTMPPFLLAYLWLAVENKQSLLVSGGTATGKTTILNALSLFVPPTSKIVSIEDTPEINLPHEHWLPMIARESSEKSEVSMFDLLKASLRERPEYLIVGEIRGAEASILFQGMATGHAGLGTVHAEKFPELVNRMTIAPINLPKQLLTELDIAIFMKQMSVKNNLVRRATSVVEVVDYSSATDEFTTTEFVTFDPSNDEFEFSEESAIISELIKLRGGEEDALWREIEKRKRILDMMNTHKILEFADVSNVIKAYYKDPGNIFNYIEAYAKKKGQ